MRIFRHFEKVVAEARHAVVAVGNFDGVHLGHQAVIAEAGRIAREPEVRLVAANERWQDGEERAREAIRDEQGGVFRITLACADRTPRSQGGRSGGFRSRLDS
jgi:cytidyltransferase-like protein